MEYTSICEAASTGLSRRSGVEPSCFVAERFAGERSIVATEETDGRNVREFNFALRC